MNDVRNLWQDLDHQQQSQQARGTFSSTLVRSPTPAAPYLGQTNFAIPDPYILLTNVAFPDENHAGTWYGLRAPKASRYFHVPRLNRIDPSMPQELSAARRLLAEYAALPPNWDSYGAVAISRQAIREANQLLQRLADAFGQPGLPETIVPVPDGGVQFEWDKVSGTLEIEVQDNGTLNVLVLPKGQAAVLREHVSWRELLDMVAPIVV